MTIYNYFQNGGRPPSRIDSKRSDLWMNEEDCCQRWTVGTPVRRRLAMTSYTMTSRCRRYCRDSRRVWRQWARLRTATRSRDCCWCSVHWNIRWNLRTTQHTVQHTRTVTEVGLSVVTILELTWVSSATVC